MGKYDEKNDYLYRTFAKNKQQKENYVINAIYSRINCKELKPVTQQCVRFEGKKNYYRVDLFFPQLNIGIECDEAYHKKQILRDEKRTKDIKDKLNSIVLQKNKYKLYRVDATLNYDKLYKKINEVATKIRKECKGIKWLSFEEQLKEIKKKGILEVADNLTFATHDEICCLFGIKARFMKGGDKPNDNYHIWYPKLAIYDAGKWAPKGKWDNRLNDNWDKLVSYGNHDNSKSHDEKWWRAKRLVFAKTIDLEGKKGYRFIGVFKIVKVTEREHIHKKVSNIIKLDNVKKGI